MIKYKTDELEADFPRVSNRLQGIIIFASGYASNAFSKDVVVTSLIRTQAEHDRIYKDRPNKPKTSVHIEKRGADLRSSNLTPHQVKELVSVINSVFCYSARLETAIYHDVGSGAHIHLQVPAKDRDYFI